MKCTGLISFYTSDELVWLDTPNPVPWNYVRAFQLFGNPSHIGGIRGAVSGVGTAEAGSQAKTAQLISVTTQPSQVDE